MESPHRDGEMRLGFRKALARRLLELEHWEGGGPGHRYNEDERAAFENGYRAAIQDVLVMVGAGLFGMAFLTVCLSPSLYHKVREKVRPWVVVQVELGRPWVIWVQHFRSGWLDRLHLFAANTCGVPFYITMLPLMFWVEELQLARQATSFMATCIYVGNAVKDAISAPRPDWSKGVRLVREGEEKTLSDDEMEYGLPSTHTINTLCMWSYIFYYYTSSSSHGDGFSVYLRTLRSPWLLGLFILNIVWCCFMMHGRIYLGMHSPIDLVVGVALALLLLHVYISVDDFVDAWMTSSTVFVPAYQLAFATLLCWTYPAGLQKTPSYNYAVYFTGVCLGVTTGVWRCPRHHSVNAAATLRQVRGDFPSVGFFFFAGRRFMLGLLVVLLLRAISKEILKTVVSPVLRLLKIPHSNHEAKDAKVVGYNVMTPIRLLNYAVVGWSVVEPCFDLFEWLQI